MPATIDFIHQCRYDDLPDPVVAQALRCTLDLIGVAAAGVTTPAAKIVAQHTAEHYLSASRGARMLFDGRRVSPVGAAFMGAIAIDSLDGHDGHQLTKGHAGAALLPALLAFIDNAEDLSGREFITTLVVGYEIACRAGIALHASACDYHTSGAWNSIACAAMGARRLGLSGAQTREALGIAEYYGPRSQMMRCIDHPSMVKDGSGWGAMTGVSAAHLAAQGFTGAPAITVEYPNVGAYWNDMGQRWQILEQNFKAYPVCRWAQPAIEAALQLQRAHNIDHEAIERVDIFTFHEATRLASHSPENTEQAQYSLPFPVATALVSGQLAAAQITGAALTDPAVLRLSQSMQLNELPVYSTQFPAVRQAHVRLLLRDGRSLESPPATAQGNYDNPIPDAQLRAKYRQLAEPALGAARSAATQEAVEALADAADSATLCDLLLENITADITA